MSTLIMPLRPSIPSYRLGVQLEGRAYVLELRWSMRESRWYMDVRDAQAAPLVLAIKLLPNWPLLYRFRNTVEGLPPGELYLVDPRATPAPPGLDELGGESAQLLYTEAA